MFVCETDQPTLVEITHNANIEKPLMDLLQLDVDKYRRIVVYALTGLSMLSQYPSCALAVIKCSGGADSLERLLRCEVMLCWRLLCS